MISDAHTGSYYLRDKRQRSLCEPRSCLCWAPPAACCPWRAERTAAPCHTSVPAGRPSHCPRHRLPLSRSRTPLISCCGPPSPWWERRVWFGIRLREWCSSGSWCCLGRCWENGGWWSCRLQLTGPAGTHLHQESGLHWARQVYLYEFTALCAAQDAAWCKPPLQK